MMASLNVRRCQGEGAKWVTEKIHSFETFFVDGLTKELLHFNASIVSYSRV